MAITPDQKAVLELLLGGQSYSELGDLLGLDEAEVRSRARSGLEAIGGSDPDRHVALSDYLLGQADPIGRADAVRHLREDPADHELAAQILAELRRLAPTGDLPSLPAPPAGGRLLGRQSTSGPRAPGASEPLSTKLAGYSSGLGERMRWLLGAGALILVAVVLIASGALSGDDEPDAAPPDEDSGSLQTDDEQQLERIELSAVGAGDASGEGIVGLTTGDQPYIDLTLENLAPAPQGQVYVVWFLLNEELGYPLSPIAPDNDGSFADRFAIPAPAIEVAGRMQFLNVSLAPGEAVLTTIEDALQAGELVIEKPGRTVLQNSRPLAPASDEAGQQAPPDRGGQGTGEGGTP
ncbi:MAG: hypothetical protein M3383_01875 [Actinomycetota bacterium]|nr:hypothetical protein [Actinomycetota bacterium]